MSSLILSTWLGAGVERREGARTLLLVDWCCSTAHEAGHTRAFYQRGRGYILMRFDGLGRL